ncbi:hypothetical protein PRUPE_2G000400 [Prunus persica]|uniref:FAS1 domain-containing protein n=1 Tax=Prunus persica TaxID=3760 RepID=A0A251Q8Q3_PRUPE|nr:hypothetical protein PRUPE_2G000400 [Prunus persica]
MKNDLTAVSFSKKTDTVINGFLPKYKNLTTSQNDSLLLYHGIPVYQSFQMLNSNNGLVNKLATDKANKFDFTIQNDDDVVSLEIEVVTAKITRTLIDEKPLVIYKVNKVLQLTELFKVKTAPVLKEVAEGTDDFTDVQGSNYSEDQTTSSPGRKDDKSNGYPLKPIFSFEIPFLLPVDRLTRTGTVRTFQAIDARLKEC